MQWAFPLHWKINFYPIHSPTEPAKQQTISESTHQTAHAVMETQGEKHLCSVKGRITVTILHVLNVCWVQLFATLWTMACQLWNFSGKNAGVGCHFLLQGIFLIQNQIFISCTAGRFFATGPPEKPSCYTFSSALELCPLRCVGNETNTLWKSQPCPFLTRILPKQVKCGRTSYLDLPMPVNDQSNTIRSRLSSRICDFSGPPRWHYW